MTETGKIGPAFFEDHVYPHLGADRADITLGPKHGVDFGLIDVDGTAVACATDPVFVLPELGLDRASWFAVHILLSDVAVSGLTPSHLSVAFNFPPNATEGEMASVMEVFHRETEALGAGIVTGHTARYAGCEYPTIGAGTAMAVGSPDAVVRPDGARPGDRLLITKGPAIETTGILATRFEGRLRSELPDDALDSALERFWDMTPVREASLAADAGPVTAMHDATEGGLLGALHELAAAGDVGLRLECERVPVSPGVEPTCSFFGIDPWATSSSGTLVLTVSPDGSPDVLEALSNAGVPAAEVGEVTDGNGVRIDDRPAERRPDPFWPTYEAFAADEEDS